MKKAGFWTADWFFGLVIALIFFALSIATGLFKGLETKAYDWGVQATSKQPSDKVAVIAIDEQSLANIGRWPWPRDIHAAMIDKLTAAKAQVIGNTIFYFEPQQDPGLQYITKLIKVYAKNVPSVAEGVTTAPAATIECSPIVTPPRVSIRQFSFRTLFKPMANPSVQSNLAPRCIATPSDSLNPITIR